MIEISRDKSRLDIDFIIDFLSQTYWAEGRSKEIMQTLIDNCINFSVYLDNRQIGYCRLLTDHGFFAYLMDVFIAPDQRGKGYSKQLIEFVLDQPDLSTIKIWRLATKDAHGLYSQFGFTPLKDPDIMMELIRQ